jgi:hypothetical protein
MRRGHKCAATALALFMLSTGSGCVTTEGWHGIVDESVGTVVSAILDVAVIQPLSCQFGQDCS